MTERSSIQRALRTLEVTTVVVFVLLALLVGYVAINGASQRAAIAKVATTTTTALCTLRHDLQDRVAASKAFLKDHPNGIPGLPPAVIQTGIENEQRTVEALSILHCPPAL